MTAEREFKTELEAFRKESETGTQFFYAYLAMHTAATRIIRKFMIALLVLIAQSAGPRLLAAESGTPPSSTESGSLSADQVVDNLVRKNQERAEALLHSEATRVYHLVYSGFPGDRQAEMTVHATYDRPSFKAFRVVSQSGSKLILDRVFKKLLDSEKEAAQPAMSARTQLNRDNYNFELLGYEPSQTGGLYVLQVIPKVRSKYVYHGKVWWTEPTSPSPTLKPSRPRTHHSGRRRTKFITNTRRSITFGFPSGTESRTILGRHP